MSGGGSGYCGITGAGAVVCWTRSGGRPVAGLSSGFSAVTIGTAPGFGSAGNSHACVLTTTGGVKCWGGNMFGELGDGGSTDSAVPVDVSGLATGIVAIDAGNSYTCALTSAGGVKCWGTGYRGQLGHGRTPLAQRTPVDVVGLQRGVRAVSVSGYYHTCALTSAGRVRCWGGNSLGQLGNGRRTQSAVPVDVLFIRR
jgi:alpha-tubulin suppressor-like RCC1 family protein